MAERVAGAAQLAEAFRKQAQACQELRSPFMHALLGLAADGIGRAGSVAGLLASWPGDPVADAVPLRLAAALHALALSGADEALAEAYGRGGNAPDAGAVWDAAGPAIEAHRQRVKAFLASSPQTNEVGRSAVLLGGFLEIARATEGRLPLRLLEIGASAGLNLPWDRYRYDLGGRASWGDPDSPVLVSADWDGGLPPMDARITVAERAGSDKEPVGLEDAEARLRLRAYVWADQPARRELLDSAIALARREGVRVEQADAATWVAERLRAPGEGRVTVLYHSIAWEYFPDATKKAIEAALHGAADRAGTDAPLAWLRLEPPPGSGPGQGQPELRFTLWPGGEERTLARAHTHGPPVTWLVR